MNLQDFIRETLVQITKGISEASTELKDSGAVVNPRNISSIGVPERVYAVWIHDAEDNDQYPAVEAVEFDVAVQVSEQSGKKGGAGVMVAAIGIGGQAHSDHSTKSESRLRFKVPMVFPHGTKPTTW